MFEKLPHDLSRLRLRPLRRGDVEAFHLYRSDPVVARYQGWEPMTMVEAIDFVESQSNEPSHEPGTWRQLAIADISTDLLVGDMGLWISPDRLKAEFGLSITPHAQGHGYGAESVVGLIGLLFLVTSVVEIEASTDTRNLPCLATLRSAGMRQVDTRRAEFKGEACTECVFSISKAGIGNCSRGNR